MESDSKSDNIVVGPWDGSAKKPPKKTLSKKDKIEQDMLYIDELSESVMIQMIHTLAEKGIDITGYRLLFNTNDDAMQTVFHIHLHLIGGEKLKNI